MPSYRDIERISNPLLSQVISGVTPVNSDFIETKSMGSASFQVNFAAGISATFKILGSLDGVSYSDMNAVISPATGSAGSSLVSVNCASIKFLMAQITPSTGSGIITILGMAATRS